MSGEAGSTDEGRNEALVSGFLNNVRGAIPLAIEQLDMMLRLVGAARGERVERFLDLGSGDGVLSSTLLDEFPFAHGWLVELPSQPASGARSQLEAHRDRVIFATADFAQPGWTSAIAAGAPFDAIVSAFAIHHLPDAGKRALYAELLELLQPEGVFINIEHVASPTRWTESIWDDYMIDAIFGQAIKAAPGRTRAEVAREYYAHSTALSRELAPLEVQCDWLREIGFENVDCYLKVLELAVFGGQRTGEEK